jgi:hypothetical protein
MSITREGTPDGYSYSLSINEYGYGYLLTTSNIYSSTNSGSTWTKVYQGKNSYIVDILDKSNILFSKNGETYIVNSTFDNWKKMTPLKTEGTTGQPLPKFCISFVM